MTRRSTGAFDREMETRQARWRTSNCDSAEQGRQNGRSYPWILPSGEWEQGLWPELRRGGRYPLDVYLRASGVQKHAGVHNLKSSWILCANLYYPFGQSDDGRALLAGFLSARVDSSIATVDALELEWAGEGDLSPERLLGETGGVRGSGQTSPDVAFFIRTDRGSNGVVLTENKFTEHSFYRCSARRTRGSDERPANPDTARCLRPLDIVAAHDTQCHQRVWGRRYWDWLAPAAGTAAMGRMHVCPAAFAGYQLLRQQALAEALAQTSQFDPVVSCVAFDARNETLKSSLSRTGLTEFTEWGALFAGKAKFATFTHQDWVAWVKANDGHLSWQNWLTFVEARYGL